MVMCRKCGVSIGRTELHRFGGLCASCALPDMLARDSNSGKICPTCGHDKEAHVGCVSMCGDLIAPYPRPCLECDCRRYTP